MSGSSNQSMTLPIVAGVVLVGGLIAVLVMRGAGDDDDAPDAAGEDTSSPRAEGAAGRPAAGGSPSAANRRGSGAGASPTGGALAIESDEDGPEPTGATIPDDRVPGTVPIDPRFGPALSQMTGWVAEDGYGDAPAPVLQSRIDRVLAAMTEGRKPVELSVGCKAGGTDCRVVGRSPTPDDIRTFAEQVEQSQPEGDERLPTVSIEETHSASTGETRFKMGIYYP